MDSHTFRILSFCSGVGGIELGFELAVPKARTVGYIENEAFACSILEARMQDKTLDEARMEWRDGKAAKLKLRDHSVHAVKSRATLTTRDWKDGNANNQTKTNSMLGRQAPRAMSSGSESQISLKP